MSKAFTQQKIIDATRAAIASNGIRVSLREIARQADVTPGLINHHFGSRAELVRQTIEKDIRDLIDSKLREDPQTFVERITELSDNRIEFLRQVLIGGGAESHMLFQSAFDAAKRFINKSQTSTTSLNGQAAVMAASALGSIAFLPHMQQTLGVKTTKDLFQILKGQK